MTWLNPTMVEGERARADLTTNREDTDFEDGIAVLDPNENPNTKITMDMGRIQSQTIDKRWFEDELVPETDQIDFGTGYDSSSGTIDVDNGNRFGVGDLVMHNKNREVMLVTAVNSDVLTVTRDLGQSTEGWTAKAGNMADNDFVTVIGNAFEQGHPLPVIRSTKEVENFNYCQDVRTPMGISEVSAASAHRGEQDDILQLRKIGLSHMRKLEYLTFWGKPFRGDKTYFETSNTAPTTMGGINHYIDETGLANQKLDETEITSDEFQDYMEQVFEYGSAEKMCYCTPRLRTALDKWGITKLNTFESTRMLGMKVDVWQSSHGTVIFKTHKQLKNPETTDWLYNFFIDAARLRWVTFSNIGSTQLRKLDPYKATGETGEKQEMQTIGCIMFGLVPTHARLRFKTIAA